MRRFVLGVVCATALLNACDEPADGCLDYRALAVNVMADKECEDCCVYPRLELRIIPAEIENDSIARVYTAGDVISEGPDSTRLLQFGFFLSDVALVTAGGEAYPVFDTLSVRDSSGTIARREEISLLRVRPFVNVDYELGSLLPLEEFTGIRMQFGVDEQLSLSDSRQPNSASPLSAANDFLLYDTTSAHFRSAAVVLELPDSVLQTSEVPGGQRWPVEVTFERPLELPRAYNLSVTIALPVARLVQLRDRPATSAERLAELLFAEAQVIRVDTTRE